MDVMQVRDAYRKSLVFTLAIVLVAFIGLALTVELRGMDVQERATASSMKVPIATQRNAVHRAVESHYGAPFLPSLEMKENVDFLLTPALLVQEAVSPEVVIAYASE